MIDDVGGFVMRALSRQIHAFTAWAFVGAILVQVFLAGSALPQLGGSGRFTTHVDFGYSIGIVALVALLAAIGGGLPRREIGVSFLVLVWYVVQTSLPAARASLPAVAALHPVNALLLFGLASWYARRAWRLRRTLPGRESEDRYRAAGADAR